MTAFIIVRTCAPMAVLAGSREVGMLEQAAREHNLQIEGSTVVGDRYSDVALGHAAGCRSIFVLTGYGRGRLPVASC